MQHTRGREGLQVVPTLAQQVRIANVAWQVRHTRGREGLLVDPTLAQQVRIADVAHKRQRRLASGSYSGTTG
jgi:hypothetical protein